MSKSAAHEHEPQIRFPAVLIESERPRVNRILLEWKKLYKDPEPDIIVRAPGRVNLMGDHTDYNEGLVLPVAHHMAANVAVRLHREYSGTVNVRSMEKSAGKELKKLDLNKLHPRRPGADIEWPQYIAGVVSALSERYGEAYKSRIPGADILISSNIEENAGLGSSAAIEVGTAIALAKLAGEDLGDPKTKADLAKECHKAESGFVKVPCGILDQYAVTFCDYGQALHLDCLTGVHKPVDPVYLGKYSIKLTLTDTGIRNDIGHSNYGHLVGECQSAAIFVARQVQADSMLKGIFTNDLVGNDKFRADLAQHLGVHVEPEVDASELSAEEQNKKKEEVARAIVERIRDDEEVFSLRFVSQEMLIRVERQFGLHPHYGTLIRHVISENDRVTQMTRLISSKPCDAAEAEAVALEMRSCLNESYNSLSRIRRIPGIDGPAAAESLEAVTTAMECLNGNGIVVGSRPMGDGFRGYILSAVQLIGKPAEDKWCELVGEQLKVRGIPGGTALVVEPSMGATITWGWA